MQRLIAGIVWGAWGGALIGAAEAVLIATTSAPEEYWLFPFAVLAYGGVGMILGVGGALLALLGRARLTTTSALAGALPAMALAIVVGRYHVIQRIFHEDLVLGSPLGLGVHAALLAAALLVAIALYFTFRALSAVLAPLLVGLLFVIFAGAVFGAVRLGSTPPKGLDRRTATASGANVVLIIADTLRADSVARRIASADHGMARLAREGVVFPQAHAQATWTRPSVATILTSLYPSQHGAVQKMDPIPDNVTTVAEAFAAAGYWTAGFVTNINVAPIFNFQQGFGEYHYLAPDFYFGATDSATRLAIYKGLRLVRERLFRNRMYFQNYYQDAEVLNQAVSEWLASSPPEPFFLLVHYMDPHDPYFELPYNGYGIARVNDPEPAASRAAELRRLYEEDVDYLDEHLAVLFDQLGQSGLYENSTIVLTSDHGEEFQDHGGWWHGTSLYEEQLHVPLIVKRAHEKEPGSKFDGPARLIDIAPTLFTSVGLPPPDAFIGHDLWLGQADEALYAEEDLEGNTLTALRIGPWKLITANPDNPRGLAEVELFNLDSDPLEKNNLAAQLPARREEMMNRLDDMNQQVGGGEGQ